MLQFSDLTSQRLVSDRHWVATSPDLISISAASGASGLALVRPPIPCPTTESRMTLTRQSLYNCKRLGHYFESLYYGLLDSHPDFHLLSKNQQIIVDKQTLGELDVIYENSQSHLKYHAELAVKFYLQIGDGAHLSDWYGPNLRDCLFDKYQKLTQQQLTLVRRLQTNTQALSVFTTEIAGVGLLTRGRLYYPYEQFKSQQFIFPEEVNADHLKGFWITAHGFAQLLNQDDGLDWYELPKPLWLAPLNPEDINDSILALTPYQMDVNPNVHQVVALNKGQEQMRGFVVNSQWLAMAQERLNSS